MVCNTANSTVGEFRLNSTYKKLAVHWLNEVQFFNQNFVQVDSFLLRNRQLLIAANRYEQREQTEPQQSKANLWQVKKEKKADGRGKKMLFIAGDSWPHCKFLTLLSLILGRMVKREESSNKMNKMKKLILGVATFSLISAAHVSCKKETISNPISSTKIGEEGLDRIPMIEINESLEELMRNDEDADEQKLNYQLFELAEATKALIQRNDFKQLVLTLAMESKLGTVYYSEIQEHAPELYTLINNKLAEKDLSIESITENMTHRPINPNPEFPETAELERYEPAIYVPNFQIANADAKALISPNIEIEIKDEDYIVAWFYKSDGSIGQTVINEETALTTTNPIFILNHNVLKSVHDEFVEFAKTSGEAVMSTKSNAMNLVCDKLKIKAGYRHEQGSNRSEFCINAVVVPLSGSPYYSYYTTSNNNDNSLKVKEVTKNQVNSSAWVNINNFWHHDDVKPSADNRVYWNSFERDWNRDYQSLGGGVTFNKVWVMSGRMRYANDWYAFQPNTVSVSHDIKFWWYDSGTPVVFDNWKSSYSLKKEN